MVTCVAAIALIAGATQAKLAQYKPKESTTRYLAKAVKIDKSSAVQGTSMMPALRSVDSLPDPPVQSGVVVALFVQRPLKVFASAIVLRGPPTVIL